MHLGRFIQERWSTSHRDTILTFAWLATLRIVFPPIPPTPIEATCNIELGEALRRIAGNPRTLAAVAERWRNYGDLGSM